MHRLSSILHKISHEKFIQFDNSDEKYFPKQVPVPERLKKLKGESATITFRLC